MNYKQPYYVNPYKYKMEEAQKITQKEKVIDNPATGYLRSLRRTLNDDMLSIYSACGLDAYKQLYKREDFQEAVEKINTDYSILLGIRGDGNCFYRSVIILYLIQLYISEDIAELDSFITRIEALQEIKITYSLGSLDINYLKQTFLIFLYNMKIQKLQEKRNISMSYLLDKYNSFPEVDLAAIIICRNLIYQTFLQYKNHPSYILFIEEEMKNRIPILLLKYFESAEDVIVPLTSQNLYRQSPTKINIDKLLYNPISQKSPITMTLNVLFTKGHYESLITVNEAQSNQAFFQLKKLKEQVTTIAETNTFHQNTLEIFGVLEKKFPRQQKAKVLPKISEKMEQQQKIPEERTEKDIEKQQNLIQSNQSQNQEENLLTKNNKNQNNEQSQNNDKIEEQYGRKEENVISRGSLQQQPTSIQKDSSNRQSYQEETLLIKNHKNLNNEQPNNTDKIDKYENEKQQQSLQSTSIQQQPSSNPNELRNSRIMDSKINKNILSYGNNRESNQFENKQDENKLTQKESSQTNLRHSKVENLFSILQVIQDEDKNDEATPQPLDNRKLSSQTSNQQSNESFRQSDKRQTNEPYIQQQTVDSKAISETETNKNKQLNSLTNLAKTQQRSFTSQQQKKDKEDESLSEKQNTQEEGNNFKTTPWPVAVLVKDNKDSEYLRNSFVKNHDYSTINKERNEQQQNKLLSQTSNQTTSESGQRDNNERKNQNQKEDSKVTQAQDNKNKQANQFINIVNNKTRPLTSQQHKIDKENESASERIKTKESQNNSIGKIQYSKACVLCMKDFGHQEKYLIFLGDQQFWICRTCIDKKDSYTIKQNQLIIKFQSFNPGESLKKLLRLEDININQNKNNSAATNTSKLNESNIRQSTRLNNFMKDTDSNTDKIKSKENEQQIVQAKENLDKIDREKIKQINSIDQNEPERSNSENEEKKRIRKLDENLKKLNPIDSFNKDDNKCEHCLNKCFTLKDEVEFIRSNKKYSGVLCYECSQILCVYICQYQIGQGQTVTFEGKSYIIDTKLLSQLESKIERIKDLQNQVNLNQQQNDEPFNQSQEEEEKSDQTNTNNTKIESTDHVKNEIKIEQVNEKIKSARGKDSQNKIKNLCEKCQEHTEEDLSQEIDFVQENIKYKGLLCYSCFQLLSVDVYQYSIQKDSMIRYEDISYIIDAKVLEKLERIIRILQISSNEVYRIQQQDQSIKLNNQKQQIQKSDAQEEEEEEKQKEENKQNKKIKDNKNIQDNKKSNEELQVKQEEESTIIQKLTQNLKKMYARNSINSRESKCENCLQRVILGEEIDFIEKNQKYKGKICRNCIQILFIYINQSPYKEDYLVKLNDKAFIIDSKILQLHQKKIESLNNLQKKTENSQQIASKSQKEQTIFKKQQENSEKGDKGEIQKQIKPKQLLKEQISKDQGNRKQESNSESDLSAKEDSNKIMRDAKVNNALQKYQENQSIKLNPKQNNFVEDQTNEINKQHKVEDNNQKRSKLNEGIRRQKSISSSKIQQQLCEACFKKCEMIYYIDYLENKQKMNGVVCIQCYLYLSIEVNNTHASPDDLIKFGLGDKYYIVEPIFEDLLRYYKNQQQLEKQQQDSERSLQEKQRQNKLQQEFKIKKLDENDKTKRFNESDLYLERKCENCQIDIDHDVRMIYFKRGEQKFISYLCGGCLQIIGSDIPSDQDTEILFNFNDKWYMIQQNILDFFKLIKNRYRYSSNSRKICKTCKTTIYEPGNIIDQCQQCQKPKPKPSFQSPQLNKSQLYSQASNAISINTQFPLSNQILQRNTRQFQQLQNKLLIPNNTNLLFKQTNSIQSPKVQAVQIQHHPLLNSHQSQNIQEYTSPQRKPSKQNLPQRPSSSYARTGDIKSENSRDSLGKKNTQEAYNAYNNFQPQKVVTTAYRTAFTKNQHYYNQDYNLQKYRYK